MKLLAGLPLALVLVSLCGTATPASDATVSGNLFWDGNRNGIQDSCDSPLASRTMVLRRDDGHTEEAATNPSGEFAFEGVEAGEYVLAPLSSARFLWPLTTDIPPLELKGWDDVSGIVVGTATDRSIDVSSTRVIGLVYEDSDADGEIDQGECGLIGAGVKPVDAPGVGGGVAGAGGFSFPVDSGSPVAVRAVPPAGNQVFWHQTYPPVSDNCLAAVMPKARYGANVYEAIIGLAPAVGDGRVGGYVFDDANGNGARDDDEGEEMYVVTLQSDCSEGGSQAVQTNSTNGEYFFNYLVHGRYTVSTGTDHRLITQGWPNTYVGVHKATTPMEVVVDVGGGLATVSFGFKKLEEVTLKVTAFDDLDGDGRRALDEPPARRVRVCANSLEEGLGYGCAVPGIDGAATIDSLHAGAYSLTVQDVYSGPDPLYSGEIVVTEEPLQTSEVAVYLPPYLKVPLDPSLASPVEWQICASDPSWVQPPFESIEELPLPTIGEWDQARARFVYEHHRYSSRGLFSDASAPLPFVSGDIFPFCPPFGDPDRWGVEQYHFIGYQPTAVYEDGDTLEVHVISAATGWWSILVEYPSQPRAVYVVNDETGEVAPACYVNDCRNDLYPILIGVSANVAR